MKPDEVVDCTAHQYDEQDKRHDRRRRADGPAVRRARGEQADGGAREAGDEDAAREEERRRPDQTLGEGKELWRLPRCLSVWPTAQAQAIAVASGVRLVRPVAVKVTVFLELAQVRVVPPIDDVAPQQHERPLDEDGEGERKEHRQQEIEQLRELARRDTAALVVAGIGAAGVAAPSFAVCQVAAPTTSSAAPRDPRWRDQAEVALHPGHRVRHASLHLARRDAEAGRAGEALRTKYEWQHTAAATAAAAADSAGTCNATGRPTRRSRACSRAGRRRGRRRCCAAQNGCADGHAERDDQCPRKACAHSVHLCLHRRDEVWRRRGAWMRWWKRRCCRRGGRRRRGERELHVRGCKADGEDERLVGVPLARHRGGGRAQHFETGGRRGGLVSKREDDGEGRIREERGELREPHRGIHRGRELCERLRAQSLHRRRREGAVPVEHRDGVGERLQVARTGWCGWRQRPRGMRGPRRRWWRARRGRGQGRRRRWRRRCVWGRGRR